MNNLWINVTLNETSDGKAPGISIGTNKSLKNQTINLKEITEIGNA
jgi:hypothetical protein